MYRANHGCRAAVKALAAAAVIPAVAWAADLAARHLGVTAGAAVVLAVFAACWIVHRARPLLHPQSQRPREPQIPAQPGNAPAGSHAPDVLAVL